MDGERPRTPTPSPRMKTAAWVLSLLLLVAAAAAAAASDRCHPRDKAALLAVKAALGNPYHFTSWTPDTPCCDWYGVDCDPSTARVVGLGVLQDANLTGTIPDAIAGLVHLQELVLHHLPGISGPIPPAIAKLSNLSLLIISWTGVSGPVPSFLAALTKLGTLDLSFNSLTGAIPASLAGISGIDLSRNRLSGPIPAQLMSKVPKDQRCYLRLSHNNLSGGVPPEFAAVSFDTVDLSRNALTGDASVLFGRGKVAEQIDVSRNALSFNLSAVGLPERLSYLDVSHNAIYGGVPAQAASLDYLLHFNVSYNRLCGAIPAGGRLASFDAFSYQHNKCLCGAPLQPCNSTTLHQPSITV